MKANQWKFSANILEILFETQGQRDSISTDNDAVTTRKAIEKYQNHLSIKVIRENIDTIKNFSFELVNA